MIRIRNGTKPVIAGLFALGVLIAGAAPASAAADPNDTAARQAAKNTAVAAHAQEPNALGALSACSPGATHSGPQTGRYFDGNGVRIHSGPHLGCTVTGEGYRSQTATLYCYTTGDSVGGDPYWDRLKDVSTGRSGYSSEVFLVIVPLPHC